MCSQSRGQSHCIKLVRAGGCRLTEFSWNWRHNFASRSWCRMISIAADSPAIRAFSCLNSMPPRWRLCVSKSGIVRAAIRPAGLVKLVYRAIAVYCINRCCSCWTANPPQSQALITRPVEVSGLIANKKGAASAFFSFNDFAPEVIARQIATSSCHLLSYHDQTTQQITNQGQTSTNQRVRQLSAGMFQ